MEALERTQELLRDWDPIGVQPGVEAPRDEYDMYASGIIALVNDGCSLDQLTEHLGMIRQEQMGLPLNRMRDAEAATSILKALIGSV